MNVQLLCLCLCLTSISLTAAVPTIVSIWGDEVPVDRAGTTEKAAVKITAHLPRPEMATGAAIVICPGGGYGGLVTGGEGHGIAKWLITEGIAGIVLEYRLPKGRAEVPLLDAQRAIRIVRSRASEWKIQPDRVGIMGFSAGGHLAASAAVLHEPGDPDAGDPIQRFSARPDFAILVYPVVSMGEIGHSGSRNNLLGENASDALVKRFSIELQTNKTSPPIYLAHAVDDTPVPIANSQKLHEALKAHQVETVCLELPSGGHGLNGYQGPMWEAWKSGSLAWLGGLLDIPALKK
ncbi:MAG: acetyl esterase/lipase [Candidatus Omnitrophota bacterium]|jgi:acetyl esterase/lipase